MATVRCPHCSLFGHCTTRSLKCLKNPKKKSSEQELQEGDADELDILDGLALDDDVFFDAYEGASDDEEVPVTRALI